MIFSFIFFIILIFLFLFLPGHLVYRHINHDDSFLSALTFSLSIGIGMFLLASYLFGWLHFYLGVAILLSPFTWYELMHLVKKKKMFSFRNELGEWGIVALGSVVMVLYTAGSGSLHADGLYFYGVNGVDGVYHLTLIRSLMQGFPPSHLALSGISIKGYNFLYDLLVASFSSIFHLPLLDLFFRFFPLIIAFLFGAAGLALSRFLGFSRKITFLIVACLYFLRGIDWYLNVLTQRILHLPFTSSGIMPSPEQLLDASVALSFIFFAISLQLLLSAKQTTMQKISLVLLAGLLPTVKVYTGLLFFVGFAVIAIIRFVRHRDMSTTLLCVAGGILAALVYLPLNFGAGKLLFAPFLLYRFYIENAPIFQHLHWNSTIYLFESKHNVLHLGFMYGVVAILFICSALGIKLLGFVPFFDKKNWTNEKRVFLFSAIIAGVLIPSFFIQTVAPLVIIQFFWIVSLLMVFVLGQFFDSFLAKKTTRVIALVGLLCLFLSLPELSQSLRGYVTKPLVIHAQTLSLVSLLAYVPASQKTLVLGKPEAEEIPIITALSGKSIYFEKEVMEFANTTDVLRTRGAVVNMFDTQFLQCDNKAIETHTLILFMRMNDLSYVLMPRGYAFCIEKRPLILVGGTQVYRLYKLY